PTHYHYHCIDFLPICLYCSCPHPALHSFPTRRSSDLLAVRSEVAAERVELFVAAPDHLLDERLILLGLGEGVLDLGARLAAERLDRKSTRLNSSHVAISYAVFCLKKKNNKNPHSEQVL